MVIRYAKPFFTSLERMRGELDMKFERADAIPQMEEAKADKNQIRSCILR